MPGAWTTTSTASARPPWSLLARPHAPGRRRPGRSSTEPWPKQAKGTRQRQADRDRRHLPSARRRRGRRHLRAGRRVPAQLVRAAGAQLDQGTAARLEPLREAKADIDWHDPRRPQDPSGRAGPKGRLIGLNGILSPICGWLIPVVRAAAAHRRHPGPASAERPGRSRAKTGHKRLNRSPLADDGRGCES